MTFKNSVASCLLQYTTLTGRASRSEFWYFQLFIAAVSLIIYIVTLLLPPRLEGFAIYWATRPGDPGEN